MANYHDGMSPEAQGVARVTGIAAGWLQQERSGARYQIGCDQCGFLLGGAPFARGAGACGSGPGTDCPAARQG